MARGVEGGRLGGLSAFHCGEGGTSAIELLLSLPILVLVMLLLIGLGHTLMAKPRALVAARYVAQYGVAHGSPPPAAETARAVGERGERWNVSLVGGGADEESVDGMERESRDAGDAGVAGMFGSFLNVLSGESRYVAAAGTRPRRGIVPRLMSVGEARGAFVVEHDTWSCDKNRGSYLTILTSRASSSLGSIPALGQVVNGIDGVARRLPCCDTYKSR